MIFSGENDVFHQKSTFLLFQGRRSGFKVGGAHFKVGGAHFKVGGANFKVGGADFKVREADFKVGGAHFKVGGADARGWSATRRFAQIGFLFPNRITGRD